MTSVLLVLMVMGVTGEKAKADKPVTREEAAAAVQAWIDCPSLHPDEQQMIDKVNVSRVRSGKPPLQPDMHLTKGARQHAYWMAKNHSMTHAGGVQENIAMGQRSVSSVHTTWMNSSGHCANILSGTTHIGCSVGKSHNGTFYWCQRFKRYKR